MNEEVKKKWIAALRSGEYEQGQSRLRPSEDTYCCLGVLCDLYVKETGIGEWRDDDVAFQYGRFKDAYIFRHPDEEAVRSHLPNKVLEWADMETEMGKIRLASGKNTTLILLNDRGSSFEEIAQALETGTLITEEEWDKIPSHDKVK